MYGVSADMSQSEALRGVGGVFVVRSNMGLKNLLVNNKQ